MKTLTLLGCTTFLAVALAGCGSDPITLGELIEAANDGNDAPPPREDEPPAEDPPVVVVIPPAGADPTPDDPTPAPGEPETSSPIEQEVVQILVANCKNCHTGEIAFGALTSVDDIDVLIESGLIIPGNRNASPIYVRMEDQTMPPAFERVQRPTQDQIELVGYFIDQLD